MRADFDKKSLRTVPQESSSPLIIGKRDAETKLIVNNFNISFINN